MKCIVNRRLDKIMTKNVKGIFFLMQTMKAYRKNRGIAPLIPHCGKVKEIRMYSQIINPLNM